MVAPIFNTIMDWVVSPTPATIYRREAFAKQQWLEINQLPRKGFRQSGEVFVKETEEAEERSLPKEISEILNGSCPFWREKKVKDTHVLVRIPEGASLRIVMSLYTDDLPPGPFISYKTLDEPVTDPYWILVTREPIPTGNYDCNSGAISFPFDWDRLRHIYQLPKAVELAAGLLAVAYRQHGSSLFDTKKMGFQICEQIQYVVPCEEMNEGYHLLMRRWWDVASINCSYEKNYGLVLVRRL